jgi:hypothetical protein
MLVHTVTAATEHPSPVNLTVPAEQHVPASGSTHGPWTMSASIADGVENVGL